MPKKVGMSWASRVTTKRNMEQVPGPDHGRKELAPLPPVTRSRPSGLLLDVHAVEDVTAEGIDLEVLHFLAHRLEHHRMCDGGPGRLLLDDDLSLLVEIRPLVVVADALSRLDKTLVGSVLPMGSVGAAPT